MKISIAGAGYVGLVTGLCLAEKGHDVTCIDVDPRKVESINAGRAPIYEPGLDELLVRHVGTSFRATTDLADAVSQTQLTMTAVGTPFDGERIDLTFVKQVARQIGAVLATKDDYHVVMVKSTVVPGTTDDVVLPILAEASGKLAGDDFGVGTNPEFLSEGTAVEDFLQPDRIVIGGIDAKTRQCIAELYESFADVPRIETTNKAAEMIKYASNSLLATLISFSNEFGNLCSALGDVDVVDVMRGVHLSQYLSPRRADGSRATAPIAAFLGAGCGFGGSCLPKDVAALVRHGQDHGEAMPVLASVLATNRQQPQRMIELLNQHHPELSGLRVAVLGLAFKPDTDDVRESPALTLVRDLVAAGANVTAFDPIANESFARAIGDVPVTYVESLADAVHKSDAVMIVTRWDEFRALPQRIRETGRPIVVIDGRRIISPEAVPVYEGIGLSRLGNNTVEVTGVIAAS